VPLRSVIVRWNWQDARSPWRMRLMNVAYCRSSLLEAQQKRGKYSSRVGRDLMLVLSGVLANPLPWVNV
ncbi:MAG: hypothetical protein ACREBW_08825, partial [Candidatus Micrarchaeaceae archaeon]